MSEGFSFAAYRHCYLTIAGSRLQIEQLTFGLDDTLDCGPAGMLPARSLAEAAEEHAQSYGGPHSPQLAALAYRLSGEPAAMDGYFPLLATLDEAGRARFRRLTRAVAVLPTFDLRVYLADGTPLSDDAPADVLYLAAGQIVEVLFYRPDLLACLFWTPRHFWLYATPDVYKRDGGVAGGCYHPGHGAVMMLLARLYEPFYTPRPGGAPFVHEFGHMLDYFDPRRGALPASTGLLPGMRPSDGAIFTPQARVNFLEGKRLEMQRYMRYVEGNAVPGEPHPVGHPYVIQNDTEFIAGYLEMFFRNPNFFAAQNRPLFEGFAAVLRQDPRRAWPEDFPVYVADNRKAYQEGVQHRFRMGLTLPTEH